MGIFIKVTISESKKIFTIKSPVIIPFAVFHSDQVRKYKAITCFFAK